MADSPRRNVVKFNSSEIENYFFYYPVGILLLGFLVFVVEEGFYRTLLIIMLAFTIIGLINEIVSKFKKNKKKEEHNKDKILTK